jgi:hypothetical protein
VTRGPVSTARSRLIPGEPGAGEQHVIREDLAGASLAAGWRRSARPLLVIAQLSDTHVMDHQSPARAELLDRYSDPDSPIRAVVGIVGSYRAQELFTYQVAEAMVRAVRETRAAPLSGAPPGLAVVTGDATDNCQRNELRAYIDLLDGGRVRGPGGRRPRRVLAGDHRVAHRLAAAGPDHRAARDRLRPRTRLHGDRQRRADQLPRRRGPGRPATLAALARELAANDWQVRDQITADGGAGAGTAADRNAVLPIDWPRPAPAAPA